MSLLTEARKRYFKKVGYTNDEYKILFDLLDETTVFDKETANYLQNRTLLSALTTGDDPLELASVEQVPYTMNNINNQPEYNDTREAKLISEVVIESVLAAISSQVKKNIRH